MVTGETLRAEGDAGMHNGGQPGKRPALTTGRRQRMDHLLKDSATLELYAWLDADAELPGWDILVDNPFADSLPEDRIATVQNYFAEYHLEYFRQRLYQHFPSRLHAVVLFATRVDAETFRAKHPARVFGRALTRARSTGAYVCSFHDSSWLDYLRLPHSLSLSTLDEIANHYWKGALVEEVGLTFMNERWREAPVIEALFQGTLEAVTTPQQSGWLPGFA
ncbi:hypothetical protein [Accumulibacter sp.]|uniref:hypothetical protein n=1 Tax=Accumulibacter sp. TaxID=2053492 RepID=UPI0025E2DEBC|nr:hypothetical protein [Accumulibacter sp.]